MHLERPVALQQHVRQIAHRQLNGLLPRGGERLRKLGRILAHSLSAVAPGVDIVERSVSRPHVVVELMPGVVVG